MIHTTVILFLVEFTFSNVDTSLLDKAADILAALCMRVSNSIERPIPTATPSQEAPTWLLKANVTVFRHADRTPKVVFFHFPPLMHFDFGLAKTQIQLPNWRTLDPTFYNPFERGKRGDYPS